MQQWNVNASSFQIPLPCRPRGSRRDRSSAPSASKGSTIFITLVGDYAASQGDPVPSGKPAFISPKPRGSAAHRHQSEPHNSLFDLRIGQSLASLLFVMPTLSPIDFEIAAPVVLLAT